MTFLLLHGGGGAATMTKFAELLAGRAEVLAPVHPGFGGTPKPASLTGVTSLAQHYVAMLDERRLTGVTVLGNSFGGWLAAEIALLGSPRVSRAVIVNGIGVEVEGHPVTDISGFTLAEIQAHSWHDPSKAPVGPSPDVRALIGYTGPSMFDPTLLSRLADVRIPVHVLWGESDRIVDPEYGKAYAAAIPGSTFTLLPRTGHLPQLETPQELLAAL
ncbi:alpha/beta fold hydrolase [Lentzea aerocolonigenes]|uniref:alpha/beta fold hydrolase n=1 Tax=Lentzea aerocolonigenes TaxID=68170 RepID=UPI0005EC1201|nr:alpha/beta hydrolase [Lentzea aerocolonigenes]